MHNSELIFSTLEDISFSLQLISKRSADIHSVDDFLKDDLDFFKTNNVEQIGSTLSGKIIDRTQLWRIVKKAFKELGLEEELSLHTLRHTCAKEIYKSTKDIHMVKNVLGHSNIQTFAIYSEMHEDKVYEEYEKIYDSK